MQDYQNIILENNIKNKLKFEWDFRKKREDVNIKINCGFRPDDTHFSRGFPLVEEIKINVKNENRISHLEFNLLEKKIPKYFIKSLDFELPYNELFTGRYFYPLSFYEKENHFKDDRKYGRTKFFFDFISNDRSNLSNEIKNNFVEEIINNIDFSSCMIRFSSIFPARIDFEKENIKNYRVSKKLEGFFEFFKEQYDLAKNDKIDLEKIKKIIIGILYEFLEDTLNDILRNNIRPLEYFYRRIKYLGPLREEPKRFYTFSDLRLLNIGLKGENTTQVLILQKDNRVDFIKLQIKRDEIKFTDKKKITLLQSLNEWLRIMNLQEITPKMAMQLITRILVTYSDKQPKDSTVSLPDVGFGLSQILPVLVEVLRSGKDDLIILEQPEIHLHPKLQGDLADFILCNAQLGKKFMIETHSEYFIKRLCMRIAQFKEIDLSKLISVYFFVPKDTEYGSKIIDVEIDEYGKILKWPKGFFDDNIDGHILRASLNKQEYNNKRE